MRFAFLVFEQRPADVVSHPDGRTEIVAEHAGAAIANAAYAAPRSAGEFGASRQGDRPDPVPSDAEIARLHSERLAVWQREMDEELARRERDAGGMGTSQGRRYAYVLRHPEPTIEAVRRELLGEADLGTLEQDDQPVPQATVETRAGYWWAQLTTPGEGFERVIADPGQLPLGPLAALLSEVTDSGWEVVHISEQRAAVQRGEWTFTSTVGLTAVLRRSQADQGSSRTS